MNPARTRILRFAVIATVLILLARLFYLQVVDQRYKVFADNNVLRYEVQYPPRGEVYDRNGEFLVQSKESYDLLVTPRDVKPFDTTLLCNILGVDKALFLREMKKA